MRDQLISAAGVFSASVIALAGVLIYYRPRSPVFWKRADYVYFSVGVVGIILGITESLRNDFMLGAESAFARRTELHRGLFVEVYTAQRYCEQVDAAAKSEAQQAIDRRFGIIRPWDDDTLEKGGELFAFFPAYITARDCGIVDELFEELIRLQAPAARKLTVDGIPWSIEANPTYFSKFRDFQGWKRSLGDPGAHDGWSREVLQIIDDIEQAGLRENAFREQLANIALNEAISKWWPSLLAFALALRIVKVHAEVKLAKAQENASRGRKSVQSWLMVLWSRALAGMWSTMYNIRKQCEYLRKP